MWIGLLIALSYGLLYRAFNLFEIIKWLINSSQITLLDQRGQYFFKGESKSAWSDRHVGHRVAVQFRASIGDQKIRASCNDNENNWLRRR